MSVQKDMSSGERLRHERKRLNWSQEKLAEKLGVSSFSINRWEHDKVIPHPYYREQLCRIFQKSPVELGFISPPDALADIAPVSVSSTSVEHPLQQMPIVPLWQMPHRRNLYFTGREAAMTYLHETLTTRKKGAAVQICALNGLGGIGKTQIAVEYAYRYVDDYEAILWARADSYQSLTTDFVTFANESLLNLPEKGDTDQAQIVEAVKRWLQQHKAWLLILDNADDLDTIYDFIPTRGEGYILITTRSQATGPGMKSFEVEKMRNEEGALLLLRRAKIIAEDDPMEAATKSDRLEAEAICRMLDGLPLALDQAAAYIEENQTDLIAYQRLYETHGTSLLKRRGRLSKREYPQSVATTWSLSFEQLAMIDDAIATSLLRLCAFLHPEAIPEAMIVAGTADQSIGLQYFSDDPLLLNDAIGTLRRYSLLHRNPETKMLTIHRLVQTVLKDTMDKETHLMWAERSVRVVSKAFPEVEFATWPTCQEYLPHALVCARLIEQWDMQYTEAAQLLDRVGNYLLDHAQFAQAEILYRRAVRIREYTQGLDHHDTIRSLYLLAMVYAAQGKYDEAEPLFRQALAYYERIANLSDPEAGKILTSLATLYDDQGHYDLSRPLHMQAVAVYEALAEPNIVDMSECLTNLALHYFDLAQYEEAEPLYVRALALQERSLGALHPGVAHTLHNLASLYNTLGKYELAEPLYMRALAIREQTLGPLHPRVAATLNNIAILYERQGKYAEAEQFHLHALSIREQTLNPFHKDVANSLHNVATCYFRQGKYEQAESLYLRSLAIHEQIFGPDHPNVAHNLNRLAPLYAEKGEYERAASLFRRALAIQEQNLGAEHLDIATTLERYAELLKKMGQEEQAASLTQRARTIRAKHA